MYSYEAAGLFWGSLFWLIFMVTVFGLLLGWWGFVLWVAIFILGGDWLVVFTYGLYRIKTRYYRRYLRERE
jgi:hypothetical protein